MAMTTFVRIVEKGSLTAAANALNTSLPTVVRILAMLERQLGVSLLNRTTRRVHLTDEGARYLDRCRAILSDVQDAEAELSFSQAEPQGRLTVTASVLFGRRYIAPIVSEFIRRNQNVNVEMLFVDRVVNMVEEGMDVAVRVGRGKANGEDVLIRPAGRVSALVDVDDYAAVLGELFLSGEFVRRPGVGGLPQRDRFGFLFRVDQLLRMDFVHYLNQLVVRRHRVHYTIG